MKTIINITIVLLFFSLASAEMTGPIFTAGEWGSSGIGDAMPATTAPRPTRRPYKYNCQVQLTDSIELSDASPAAREKGFKYYREFAIANIEMNPSLQKIEDTKILKWSLIKVYKKYDVDSGADIFMQEDSQSSKINVNGHNFSFGVYLEEDFKTGIDNEVIYNYVQVKQEVGPELYAVAQQWDIEKVEEDSVEVQTKVSGLSWISSSEKSNVPLYLMRLVCTKVF